jgi:hypothetical protein
MASYARGFRVEFDNNKAAARLRKAGAAIEVGMGTVRREFAARGAERARAKGASLGSVHRHASAGISAVRDTIKMDTGRHPEIMGAEFGGGRRPRTRQFPPFRGSGPRTAGYMLYPALRELEGDLDTVIARLIDRAL